MKTAKFLGELHVLHDGKLKRVSDLIHYLKGSDTSLRQHIALGLFNFLELNGKSINEPQVWKLDEMETLIGRHIDLMRKLVYVLPYKYIGEVAPQKARKAVEDAWHDFVTLKGYEGLVVYLPDTQLKIKTEYELDAVIVGINKNDGFHKKQGTSVRLAVMKDKDTFVEIGDVASGITLDMREQLWAYKKDFALDETNLTAYAEPVIIVKLVFTDFFEREMPSWRLVKKTKNVTERQDAGMVQAITMRHPRLAEVRIDKSVSPMDIGMNQITILRERRR